MTRKLCDLFGGEGAEQYNALMTAFETCAEDEGKTIYGWLDKVPKTSMVVHLVDALHNLGFIISPKK